MGEVTITELNTRYRDIVKGGKWLDPFEFDLSHRLSTLLRHKAKEWGVGIRSDGFVAFSQAFWRSLPRGATMLMVLRVVKCSAKNRFCLYRIRDKFTHIRCNRGHSIKDVVSTDLFTTKVTRGDLFGRGGSSADGSVYHGTKPQFLESILSQGLRPGGSGGPKGTRNHVHLSPFAQWDPRQKSGMRHESPVVLELNGEAMLASGIVIWESLAGAYLVDTMIPPNFILRAYNRDGTDIIWEAGDPDVPPEEEEDEERKRRWQARSALLGPSGAQASPASTPPVTPRGSVGRQLAE